MNSRSSGSNHTPSLNTIALGFGVGPGATRFRCAVPTAARAATPDCRGDRWRDARHVAGGRLDEEVVDEQLTADVDGNDRRRVGEVRRVDRFGVKGIDCLARPRRAEANAVVEHLARRGLCERRCRDDRRHRALVAAILRNVRRENGGRPVEDTAIRIPMLFPVPNPRLGRARALVLVAALAASVMTHPPAQAQESSQRHALTLSNNSKIDLTLVLQDEHVDHADRIVDAARESLEQYGAWLAPLTVDRLTIATRRWGSAPGAPQPEVIAIDARWLQPERSMTLEAEVARGIARHWWSRLAIADRPLADGLVGVRPEPRGRARLDRRHQRLAYSTYETRLFGGLVPWAIRALRVERQTAGIGRSHYRRNPTVDPRDGSESARLAQAGKVATALVTLERYLGWPVLQRGLRAAIDRFGGRAMSTDEFISTLGDAADRDLSWFLDPYTKGNATWDYAVTSLTSQPAADACGEANCVRSDDRAATAGHGTLHRHRARTAWRLRGGARQRDRDLIRRPSNHRRSLGRTSRIEDARVSRAGRRGVGHYDPRRVLLLDLTALNNTQPERVESSPTRWSWTVRWTTWLQDVLLTHAFLF